jgi:hypothetical protein
VAPRDADVLVVWGWAQQDMIAPHMASGGDVIVMEQGFLGNRLEWSSIGFNGLNGRADFVNPGSPSDRFERHFAGLMKPWKQDGEYVLLMGQVPGDQALAHVDIRAWYRDAISRLADWEMPVMFRPHPLSLDTPAPDGAIGLSGDLSAALDGAAAAVTFNSNTGVDAALAGVPVYALDEGSMARPVACHDLFMAPQRPDRGQWVANLAWCQWTVDEVAAGEAWAHLRRHWE